MRLLVCGLAIDGVAGSEGDERLGGDAWQGTNRGIEAPAGSRAARFGEERVLAEGQPAAIEREEKC